MAATEEQIKEAYEYYRKYKKKYQWSEDLIQDAIMAFYQYYDGSTKVTSFAKLCAQSKKNTELAKLYSNKHNSNGKLYSIDFTTTTNNSHLNEWQDFVNAIEAAGATPTPEYFKDEDRMVEVNYYLQFVTKRQLKVIQLHYFEHMTQLEIANKLGKTRANVSKLLDEAKKRILNHVAEQHNKK